MTVTLTIKDSKKQVDIVDSKFTLLLSILKKCISLRFCIISCRTRCRSSFDGCLEPPIWWCENFFAQMVQLL